MSKPKLMLATTSAYLWHEDGAMSPIAQTEPPELVVVIREMSDMSQIIHPRWGKCWVLNARREQWPEVMAQ